jgi:fatty acid desaturase
MPRPEPLQEQPLSGAELPLNKEGFEEAQPRKDLWYVHGKAYDLSSFVERHPGGRNNLLETRGRNVTELFESVHALSETDVHSMLKKFEVPNVAVVPSSFTYEEDGVFQEITRRVRKHFEGRSYKASTGYYIQLLVMIGLYAGMMLTWLRADLYNEVEALKPAYPYIDTLRPLIAFVTGGWLMILFFYGAIHDASHFALSKKAWVNSMWSIISCHWGLWHSNIWFQHHAVGHHSYTGVPKLPHNQLDPDLRWTPWLRKHPWFKLNGYHKFQQFFSYLLFLFFPNQYMYQVLMYVRARILGRVFSFQISDYRSTRALWETALAYFVDITTIFVHFVVPFVAMPTWQAAFCIWTYYSGCGFMYFVIVAPNHDTQETQHHMDGGVGMDWGELQIRHSGDFSHESKTLTMFFGGMNHQITHHLYPAVCNIHYPEISKIVQDVCKERNIPFNYSPSLLSAHISVWKNYRDLGGGQLDAEAVRQQKEYVKKHE